jgi:hypothetical protein
MRSDFSTLDPELIVEPKTAQKYVLSQGQSLYNFITTFNLRRRYNPHHPQDQIDQETMAFKAEGAERLQKIKSVYSRFREHIRELSKGSPEDFQLYEALDRLIQDDMENIFNLG